MASRGNKSYKEMSAKNMQYRIGDIIRLKDRTKYNITRLDDGKCSLFTIESIDGDDIKLLDVDEFVNINEIRPVLIDSEEAKLIWEDTIIAACTILDGDEIPIIRIDKSYFMDKFKVLMQEDKSYYDIIHELGFQYVHEVQHWLYESGHVSTKLRINEDELIQGYLYK